MKKYMFYFFALCFVFSIFSCSTEESESEIDVSSVVFEKDTISINAGESAACILNINPKNAEVEESSLSFELIPKDICSIVSSDVSGCVIKGLKKGSCVLTVNYENLKSYLQIDVSESTVTQFPYISFSDVDVKIEKGRKRTVVANLIGGSSGDINNFTWTCSDKSVCDIQYSGSTAVITAKKFGSATVEVTNPICQYPSSFIVVVPEKEDEIFYLTTEDNYINVLKTKTVDFNVNIIGGNENDYSSLKYNIIEGNEYFSISGSGNKCSVIPKKAGSGIIEVIHPDAKLSLKILVNVTDDTVNDRILSDVTMFYFNEKKSKKANLSLLSGQKGNWSFEVTENNIIDYFSYNDELVITPLKSGICSIIVSNSLVTENLEIKIIVDDIFTPKDYCTINTKNNVIKTQVGSELTELECNLLGGNESDRNSFNWVVSDSSIIQVETDSGNVTYSRNAVQNENNLNIKAYIKPVSSGHAVIEVTHPKSLNSCIIDVFVYPSGTFSNNYVSISGETFIKAAIGKLNVYKINENIDLEKLQINVSDPSLIECYISNDTIYYKALKKGSGFVKITGSILKEDFIFNVYCAEEAELENKKFIYSDISMIKGFEGNTVNIEIKGDFSESQAALKVANENSDICSYNIIAQFISCSLKESGYSVLCIEAEGFDNKIFIPVECIKKQTSVEYPYEFTGYKFISLNCEKATQINLSIRGADSNEINRCEFDYNENEIEVFTENGKLFAKGKKPGRGNLIVKNEKISEALKISYIIYETESESNNSYEFWFDENTYEGIEGDNILIKINQTDSLMHDYNISVEEIDIIDLSREGNYLLLKLLKKGITKIKVQAEDGREISVLINVFEKEKNAVFEDFYFNVNTIYQSVKGEAFSIIYQTSEDYQQFNSLLEWDCPSKIQYTLLSNGIKCICDDPGEYEISCKCENTGLNRKIKVIIYDNENQMLNDRRIILDSNTYYIKEGERIELEAFVTGKDCEEIEQNLLWQTNRNYDGISFNYSGNKCVINGLKEGIYEFVISENSINNNFNFKIFVSKNNYNSLTEFNFQRRIFVNPGRTSFFNFSINKDNISESEYNNVIFESDSLKVEGRVEGQRLIILCEEEGEYYCTLKRYGINDYKFLLVCKNNYDTEENYIFSEQKIVTLGFGEKIKVPVFYNEQSNEGYSISITGNNCIDVVKDNESINITAIQEGECSLTLIKDNASYVIYVKVYSDNYAANNNIICEEILYVKKGENINSYILCEQSVNYEWNEEYIDVIGNGNSFSVKGIKRGITQIKISVNERNYRIIKVFVYEDENDKEAEKIINVSKRRWDVKKGNQITFVPYINGNDINNIILEKNGNIFDIENENGFYNLNFKEEGYSTLKLKYFGDSVTIYFYCTDSNTEADIINSDFEDYKYYIKGEENYAFIKIDDAKTFAVNIIDFEGNYYPDGSKIIWKVSDPEILRITSTSNLCTARALKKGRCLIYASSLDCANIFTITVDTGYEGDYYNSIYSFIKFDNTVIGLDVNEEIQVEGTFNNINKENYNTLKVNVKNDNICNVNYLINGNKIILNIKGLSCGNTSISLKTDDSSFETVINVIVSFVNSGEKPFLTTSQNYSVMKRGDTINLSVRLRNYEEYDMKNFRWKKISGSECITLIGNGNDIQVYAVKEGECIVECVHTPTSASIELYINVSNSEKTVKYMTTDTLFIETNTSKQLDVFKCVLVGGNEKDNITFKYTIDNEDVISIVNNNNEFYYRGLKEGTARVHISNSEAGCVNELDIVFFVTESKNNYIMKPDCNSIYLKKNGTSKNVKLAFENCPDIDEQQIEWFIYSQSLMDDNVISLISSGKNCVIKPINNGYATVKAVYAKLNLSVSIGIFVDETGQICFKQNKADIEKGESVFVEMNIPEYMYDMSSYITYQSLDETICSAFGTGRVCCIEAVGEGSCIVRAVNSFDQSVSEIGVNVHEIKEDEPVLSLRKNTLLLNPRSGDQYLSAFITGKNIDEFENDNIEWEIIGDTTKCLSMYPDRGSDALLRLNVCSDTKDKDYGKVKCGQAVIKVSHPLCSVPKTMYVCIEEIDNFFTLDKYSAKTQSSQSVTVTCNILSGSQNDYDNVRWSVSGYNDDKYGNRVEVARTLNSEGKSCTVFGLNEGICTLTAFYLGNAVSCEVTVSSDRTFRINGATNIKMFPDVTEDNYVDIAYVLRPSSNIPIWSVQNIDKPLDMTILTVEDVPGEQKIRLRPCGIEGRCKITGFVVGVGQVNVNVEIKFEPELKLLEEFDDCIIEMEDGSENIKKFRFASYPFMYYVGITKGGKYSDDIEIYTENLVRKNDFLEGTLCVKAKKEVPNGGCTVLLQQYTDPSLSESSKVDYNASKLSFAIAAYYPENGIYLGFRRGRGGFSMRENSLNAQSLYNVNDRFIEEEGENSYYKFYDSNNNDNTVIDMGDAEQHYFVLKGMHENSFMENLQIKIVEDEYSDGPVINEILQNKLNAFNKDTQNNLINNIEIFSQKSKPKINGFEEKNNGSWVFDISTGDYNYKYGVNWNIKEKPNNNKDYTENANIFFSDRIKYKIPRVYYGSVFNYVDEINCNYSINNSFAKGNAFRLPGYSLYFFRNYNVSIGTSGLTLTNNITSDSYWPLYKITSGSSWTTGSGRDAVTNYGISSTKFFEKWPNNMVTEDYFKSVIANGYSILDRRSLSSLYATKMFSTGSQTTHYYYEHDSDRNTRIGPISVTSYKMSSTVYIIEYNYPGLGKRYRIVNIPTNFPPYNDDYDDEDRTGFYWTNDDAKSDCYDWLDTAPLIHLLYCNGTYYMVGKIDGDNDVNWKDWVLKETSETLFYVGTTENTPLMSGYASNWTFNMDELYNNGAHYIRGGWYLDNNLNGYSSPIPFLNPMSNVGTYQLNVTYNGGKQKISTMLSMKKSNYTNYINMIKNNDGIVSYYNNDTTPDFEYDKYYLVISWKNVRNKTVEKKIPLKVLFFNNYADYYTYEDGQCIEHPDRINTYIKALDFN